MAVALDQDKGCFLLALALPVLTKVAEVAEICRLSGPSPLALVVFHAPCLAINSVLYNLHRISCWENCSEITLNWIANKVLL